MPTTTGTNLLSPGYRREHGSYIVKNRRGAPSGGPVCYSWHNEPMPVVTGCPALDQSSRLAEDGLLDQRDHLILELGALGAAEALRVVVHVQPLTVGDLRLGDVVARVEDGGDLVHLLVFKPQRTQVHLHLTVLWDVSYMDLFN